MKLSKWYSHEINPVNIGWYQAKGEFVESESKPVWRYWDGDGWLWYRDKNILSMAAMCNNDKWRGIVK